mmetsp:Transcript_20017/g.24511  ORF Transcript_20017/g.24511 Transcript_20017/m.24511 type:complete len:517 (-) Transcript_20017:83-1633(-)
MRITNVTHEDVQTARIGLGLCPTCGIQTQCLDKNGIFAPVTNSLVNNSRCLLCVPINQSKNMSWSNNQVQKVEEILFSKEYITGGNGDDLFESVGHNVTHHSNGNVRILIKPKQVVHYCKSDCSLNMFRNTMWNDNSAGRDNTTRPVSEKNNFELRRSPITPFPKRQIQNETDTKSDEPSQLNADIAKSDDLDDKISNIIDVFKTAEVRDRIYCFKKYNKCFIGSEAIDILVTSGLATCRADAVQIGLYLQCRYLLFDHVCSEHDFEDKHLFYRFNKEARIGDLNKKSTHGFTNELPSQSVVLTAVTEKIMKFRGILKNRTGADELFQKGWNHLMGDNHIPIDKAIGERHIATAMRDGCVAAKAFCFFLGWSGHNKDYSEALTWFSKGIHSGKNFAACLAIKGYLYLNGYGVKVDNKKGVRLIKMAVTLDHAWAQNMLGQYYMEGDVVEKNVSKARKLFNIAATRGYCKAQYNLGNLYLCGGGTQINQNEGLKWMIRAARQDHWKARERLGWNSQN